MEAHLLDRLWRRGQTSVDARLDRWRSKSWQIGQCAAAAGVAWFVAHDLVGHATPFFAPVAAVVSLGTSYGQRLRRVAEVTVGVAVGVFLADLIVAGIGSGWWQLAIIVALAMSTAVLLDGGQTVHDAGGRAVDRGLDADPRPGRRADPLDRRRDRRRGRARRGDRRPGSSAAAPARAGRSAWSARSPSCCGRPAT